MNTIANIFTQARNAGTQPISFEIFPPKGELSMESARSMAEELAKLDPSFISVTYSAGGSGNKQATAEIAAMIQDDFSVPTIAHLTCAGASEESIAAAASDMKGRGIRNVLALRGDLPEGYKPGDFKLAKDLVPRLTEAGFCVGAAAYPEGHIDCDSMRLNVEHLKQKKMRAREFRVAAVLRQRVLLPFPASRRRRQASEAYHGGHHAVHEQGSDFAHGVHVRRFAAKPHHQAAGPLRERSGSKFAPGGHRIRMSPVDGPAGARR